MLFNKTRKYIANKLLPFAKHIVRKQEGLWHHRKMAFHLLEGNGLELGAMHNPQKVSANASVEYLDIISKEEALNKYPELNPKDVVHVTHILNIDTHGLFGLNNESKDFVILCHVIEHTANPFFIVEEIFRVLKPKGYFVIACPDKDYTFDKERPLTSYDHLITDWESKINYVEDKHLLENVHYFKPDTNKDNKLEMEKATSFFKEGRAHVHVWNSTTIKEHLTTFLKCINVNHKFIFESIGFENKHEYFAILKKI